MSNPEAARLAALIRSGMKDHALSGAEMARRVRQLTGTEYQAQYLSRRLNGSRPLIIVPPDFYLICRLYGIDPPEAAGAVVRARAEQRLVSDDLYPICEVLGLDPVRLVEQAIAERTAAA